MRPMDAWASLVRRAGATTRRLRMRALAGVGLGAATTAGLFFLFFSFLPPAAVARRGSPLPLLALLLLLLLVAIAALAAGRAVRSLTLARLAAEAESSAGLRAGEFAGALELEQPARPASEALWRLHRHRVATRVAAGGLGELFPVTARRWRLRLRAGLLSVGAVGGLLAGSAVARPGPTRSAARALADGWRIAFPPPLAPLAVTPGDAEVRRGDSITVGILASARPEVRLAWQVAGEPPVRQVLKTDVGGRATATLGPIRSPLGYWVEAGDGATSDTFSIRLLEPLLVERLQVRLVYPAYLSRQPEVEGRPVPPLLVPAGTRIEVEGSSNYPLRSARLERLPADPRAGAEGGRGRGGARDLPLTVRGPRFSGSFRPAASGTWGWRLLGEAPGEPLLPRPLRIRVVPDSLPTVRVLYPGRDTLVGPESVLPLVVDARDDIGLRRVELVSWRGGESPSALAPTVQPLEGAGRGERRTVLRPLLDLRERGFLPGDTAHYVLRAFDEHPGHGPGVSDTFRVVLLSVSEALARRERSTESLGSEAAAAAGQAAELERAARAAERRAAGEALSLPEPGAAGAARAESTEGELAFERTEEARRVRGQAAELQEALARLEEEVARLAEQATRGPPGDPALAERLRRLGELYRELGNGGLGARLAELEEALQRLDLAAVRAALEQVVRQAEMTRRKIEESLGLLERAALEQGLKASRSEAERLAGEQRAAAQAPDATEAWAKREQLLAKDAEALAARLAALERRLDEAGMREVADAAGTARREVVRAGAKLREAAAAGGERAAERQRGARADGGDAPARATGAGGVGQRSPAHAAAEDLQQAAETLGAAQGALTREWKEEAVEAIRRARVESLALAEEEERLGREVYGSREPDPGRWQGRQAAVRAGLEKLRRSLSEASRRTAMVDPQVGEIAAGLTDRMGAILSRAAASGGRQRPPQEEVEGLADGLNEIALRLIASERAAAAAESATGLEEALQQMAGLAQRQEGVTRQTGGAASVGESAPGREALLRRLAAEQADIGRRLRELGDEPLLGDPGEMGREAGQLAERLEAGRADAETLGRQRRLFRRMLDAGRTLEQDEPDPGRRESRTGRTAHREIPPLDPALLAGPRFPHPTDALLKNLPAFYRPLVFDYFDRLNAPGRNRRSSGGRGEGGERRR
ncbi:MAG: hypothetical protein ACE5HP_06680 [Gemmatimonadota bacterium]